MTKTMTSIVYLIEGFFPGERKGFWSPILHPDGDRYAIFTDRAEAQSCLTYLKQTGHDWLVTPFDGMQASKYRLSKQTGQ